MEIVCLQLDRLPAGDAMRLRAADLLDTLHNAMFVEVEENCALCLKIHLELQRAFRPALEPKIQRFFDFVKQVILLFVHAVYHLSTEHQLILRPSKAPLVDPTSWNRFTPHTRYARVMTVLNEPRESSILTVHRQETHVHIGRKTMCTFMMLRTVVSMQLYSSAALTYGSTFPAHIPGGFQTNGHPLPDFRPGIRSFKVLCDVPSQGKPLFTQNIRCCHGLWKLKVHFQGH